MKVAHLTTVDTSLRYLVLAQLVAVHEAGGEAVGISAAGPDVEAIEAAGVRHINLPASTRGMDLRADLKAAYQLWRVLRRERFDVLHTHNPKPGLYGRVLGRLCGVPCVVNTVHGLYATADDPWVRRLVVYALEAFASRFSHAELVQNPEDADLMAKWHLAPRDRIVLLGNGVDLVRFDPDRFDADHRGQVRRDLGIDANQVVVGTVGRLVAEKGYQELFSAMSRLGRRYVLLAVGPEDPSKPDALTPSTVARAKASGVKFLGMRSDVDALYAAMDVFVLASHREGYPRAAMEAAAMGLPIVATNIRGCRQVVEHGANGLLVPVRDPTALAGAVRLLGEDAARRATLGGAGRARARIHFDERLVVEKVMATYTRLRTANWCS